MKKYGLVYPGTGVIGAASADTLGYRNTFAGLTVSLAATGAYAGGSAGTGDGGNDGAGVTAKASDWHLSYAVPMVDGLTIAHGVSTVDFSDTSLNDDTSSVSHILYSTGPVSVGYRMAEFHDGTAGATELMLKLTLSHLT